jgi:hypothetical protein
MIRTSIGLAAATLFIAGPAFAGPAFAGPPDPGYAGGSRGPGADLTLTYMAQAGFAAAVKLQCDPPGGGHPKPADACAELTAVGGDPDRIEPGHGACMMIYAPITAQITGDWHGTAVTWHREYGNGCEMRRALGVLFAF